MPTQPTPAPLAARLAPPTLAAVVALAISTALPLLGPLLGPLLIALIMGALVANSRWGDLRALQGHASLTKLLLRLGVVLLGLRLPFGDIVGVGAAGLVVVTVTVAATYSATMVIGSRLALDKRFVTLLAAGFSICGAAAIAAVDDAVRAKEKDVALAVALVTLFGSAMIAIVPWAASALGLTDDQAAVWAGASIHEVAQVVAAASIVGSGAIAIATTIKLGRVMLLAPVYALSARGSQHDGGTRLPLVPWFVIGFVIAVAIRSTSLVPDVALDIAQQATTLLLAAGMFGLGLGFRIRDLWPVPWLALALASASTAVAAGTSLALVAALL